MRTIFILAFTLVPVVSTQAQDHDGVMVWGAGTASCGEFVRVVSENPKNEVAFGQWLHGYITALNAANPTVVDHAAGIDRTGLLTWITDYCKAKPLDSFYTASAALVHHLKTEGRLRNRKAHR